MADPVFRKVAPVENFPEAEARIAAFWREHEIFHRSLAKRAGGPRWTFYEGPPTANGLPHNGSVLTRVMKDVFPRYRSMRGYDVPRNEQHLDQSKIVFPAVRAGRPSGHHEHALPRPVTSTRESY